MPNPRNKKVEHEEYSRIIRPGAKKILIEQTTILSILAIIVFKTLPYLRKYYIFHWGIEEKLYGQGFLGLRGLHACFEQAGTVFDPSSMHCYRLGYA